MYMYLIINGSRGTLLMLYIYIGSVIAVSTMCMNDSCYLRVNFYCVPCLCHTSHVPSDP